MKLASRTAATLLLLAGVAGCDSIGEGSTVESLRIVVAPVDTFDQGVFVNVDTVDEKFHMYTCFCSNLAVLATFTDGTVVNFSSRAKWSSSAPGVVQVLDYFGTTDVCPLAQVGAGLLIPQGLGESTITAEFGGLRDTLKIEVADATLNADGSDAFYELIAAPPAAESANAVAVGATLPLRVRVTLDGRRRVLDPRTFEWSFDNEDDALATVNSIGFVQGIGPTAGQPRVVHATFPACAADPIPTLAINVGDVIPPLTLEREPPDFFATDGMLATNSDEFLKVTANLDFGGGSTGSQLISSSISLSFTDGCTIVDHDPADATGTTCRTQTNQSCPGSPATPTCASTAPTSCPVDMTPCRTTASPVVAGGRNRIVAVGDNGSPTNFTVTYPSLASTATTLAAEVPAGTPGDEITIAVAALTGYPTIFPWYGVIKDVDGTNREDVRVTAASGTTLTAVRGISGTPANLHLSGSSFAQRSYSSDSNAPLPIRGKEGTLKVVAVDPPGTLAPLGTLQLTAQGTFEDASAATRTQRVSRLSTIASGSPTVTWFSNNGNVAVVTSGSGFMTSTSPCGGKVSVRARASTSTDSTTATFDSTATTDDEACENTDPLCDQVEVCVARQNPLPLGFACEDPETTCGP